MLKKLREILRGSKQEREEDKKDKVVEESIAAEEVVQETERGVRPLTPYELEEFKKGMGITPHNYWTWASRTKNFKLLTDGTYVWVEGYEEHIGKRLPLTQQRAWTWEFVRQRLQDFGGSG